MRQPSRIKIFCERLATLWQKVPDWRFGQLITNAFNSIDGNIFYMEDDEMIKYLENYIKNILGE